MEYKVLEPRDIPLMGSFTDDQNTAYDAALLQSSLEEKHACACIAKDGETIAGFAYGYVLPRPDGLKDFYLHAIDIQTPWQNRGCGTELIRFIHAHAQSLGCRKLFLITDKGNPAACKCYEKAGGIRTAEDDAVYVFR